MANISINFEQYYPNLHTLKNYLDIMEGISTKFSNNGKKLPLQKNSSRNLTDSKMLSGVV